jgi:muramoyltetrapeptide carboxypeptidase
VGDRDTSEFTRRRLLEVLGGDGTGLVPADPDDPFLRPIRGGRAGGPLVGGDLWLLLQTMGTPWEVELAGAILFFEEFDAPPWYVDGMLTQLGQAGKLAGVVGVVVGEMERCDWREGRPEWPRTKSLEQVLEEHLEPLGVPVLYKLPLGHGRHLATLPLGVTATLDADARRLSIDQPALRHDGHGHEPGPHPHRQQPARD